MDREINKQNKSVGKNYEQNCLLGKITTLWLGITCVIRSVRDKPICCLVTFFLNPKNTKTLLLLCTLLLLLLCSVTIYEALRKILYYE